MQSRSVLDRSRSELVALFVRWLIIERAWAKPSMGGGFRASDSPWVPDFRRDRRPIKTRRVPIRKRKAEVRTNQLKEALRLQTCQSPNQDASLSPILWCRLMFPRR